MAVTLVRDININLKGAGKVISSANKVKKSLEEIAKEGEKLEEELIKGKNATEQNAKSTTRYSAVLDKLTNSVKILKTENEKITLANGKKATITSKSIIEDEKEAQAIKDKSQTIKANIEMLEKQIAAQKKRDEEGITTTTRNKKENGLIDVTTSKLTRDAMGNVTKEITHTTEGLEKMSFMQKISTGNWETALPWLNKTNKALNALRWSMVNVTFALAGVAAFLAPFALLTKFGVELETLFNRIAVVTGVSMEEAKKAILDLRQGSMFSIQEMGNAFLEFAKQGFTAQETMQALPAVMSLAVVGFTSVEEATKIVAQTLHEFSMNAAEAAHVADVLAAAANASAADVETFGVAMSYAAPIAEQAGIGFEETAAALSILSNQGLSASKSGTSLAAAFTQMISPTETMEKKMRSMGISFFDAKGDMNDINTTIKELTAALSGLPDQEKLKFLTDLFQTRGARAISALMTSYASGSGTIEEFTDKISEQGYALKKMLEVETTTASQMKADWNDIKQAFVPAGEGMVAVLADILAGYNRLLDLDWKKLGEKHREAFGEERVTSKSEVQDRIDKLNNERDRLRFLPPLEFKKGGKGEFGPTEESKKRIAEINSEISKLNQWKDMIGTAENSFYALRDAYEKNIMSNKQANTEIEEFLEQGRDWIFLLDAQATPTENAIKLLDDFNKGILKHNLLSNDMTSTEKDAKEAENARALALEHVSKILIGAKNDAEDFFKGIEDGTKSSSQKKLEDYINTLTQISRKFAGGNDYESASSYAGMAVVLEEQLDNLGKLEEQLKIYEADTEMLKQKADEAQDALDKENDSLSALKKGLSEVGNQISKLSKIRFTGETDIQQLISNVDRYLKEKELAERGITDVQGFLQASLAKSKDGYDSLVDSIKSVTKEAKSSKSEFDAWTQTIETFIRETIETGNELGTNMSQTITQFQTQLLSTSKFEDSTGENEQAISLLKDAYDVYYGGMHDDVKYAMQAHEDQVNGVYATSEGVIAALQAQWASQVNYNKAILESENRVKSLQDSLDKAQEFYEGYRKQVKLTTSAINNFMSKVDDLIDKMKKAIETGEGLKQFMDNRGSSGGYEDKGIPDDRVVTGGANIISGNVPSQADLKAWDKLKDTLDDLDQKLAYKDMLDSYDKGNVMNINEVIIHSPAPITPANALDLMRAIATEARRGANTQ